MNSFLFTNFLNEMTSLNIFLHAVVSISKKKIMIAGASEKANLFYVCFFLMT